MNSQSWITESVADCLVPVNVSGKTKIQARDYKASGRFPIIDQGQEPIAGWTDDESGVIDSPLPLVVFGDHTRVFKFADKAFARGADGTQLLRPKDDIDPLFFFFACRAIDLPSRGYNRHFTALKQKVLSYPVELTEQRFIAAILQSIDRIIDLHRRKAAVTGDLFEALLHKLMAGQIRAADLDMSAIAEGVLAGSAS